MGSAVGAVVSVSICRELGPVLTALMVTGRVGASMSAEIGTMKVTEQIDALRALAVHPIDYLVVPRTLAMMVSMPLLVAECIGVGIVAGYFVAIFLLDVNGTYYVANMVRWTQMRDIVMALSKAFCFALLIVFCSLVQMAELSMEVDEESWQIREWFSIPLFWHGKGQFFCGASGPVHEELRQKGVGHGAAHVSKGRREDQFCAAIRLRIVGIGNGARGEIASKG